MKISNETKIGALTTLAVVLLIIGYNFLQGRDFFTSSNIFYAKYKFVDGLALSNPIKLRGMNVGRVTEMSLDKDKETVIVKFTVRKDIEIPKGTVAKIISADLLGSKAIDLNFSQNAELHENTDTLLSVVQESLTSSVRAEMLPVKQKAENLLSSIDSVMTIVRSVLNPDTRKSLISSVNNIQSTLEKLDQSTGQLNNLIDNNVGRLDRIFQNVESITLNLKNNEKTISTILANASSFSDSLQQSHIKEVINDAAINLAQVKLLLEKIHSGQGTLGMLINDEQLYRNLEKSSKNLDLLIEDIKLHPKRYVEFSILGGGKKK
ncbi:MAG: MCE family protein [Bacteroidetes bacterium]|nr:MCE family protein [Bacteroidota bacterium]